MTTAEAIAYLKTVPNDPLPRWKWRAAATPAEYFYRTPRAIDVLKAAGFGEAIDVGVGAVVLASEFPLDYPAYLLAGGHCLLNGAHATYPNAKGTGRAQDAILNKVVRSSLQSGYFGQQAGGRWCSSWQPPTERTVAAMRLVLQGIGAELARGARQWLDPNVQHAVHTHALEAARLARAEGRIAAAEEYAAKALRNPTPELVTRRRYAEGRKWVGEVLEPNGERIIDPGVLMEFGPQGVSLDQALAALARWREEWNKPA